VAPPAERFAQRSGPLRLLVVDGSLGAAPLNQVLPRALALMAAERRPVVTHQAGEKQLEALRAAYAEAGVEGELLPFIEDMAARYAEADLVLCRAGALTVAELAAVGVAAVLVPLPHAVDDHQTGNARFLADRNAAYLLPQSELEPQRLADILASLDRAQLLHVAEAARALAKPAAADAVARICVEVADGKKR
jgi:UDP-N-acetylglucosamine--N-acetylmuramyl-(pentapeptide) pyrophosphoryl-undecaprenol N-acetylglucosamine transferase